MGVFSRLGRIIKSNINSILDAAEDPEKSINQLLVEMRTNHKEAKEQVAMAMVEEKKLQRKLQEAQQKALEWKQKAKVAVQRGNDDLAKQALARAKAEAELAGELAKNAEVQKRAIENLKVALQSLDKKIEEAKRRKHVLLARQKTVEATMKIGTTTSSIKVDTDAFNEFDRLAEKIEDMEVKAGIMLEMNTDALESKFEEDAGRDMLDDELDQLKLEMGVIDTTHQLTADAGKGAGGKKAKKKVVVIEEEDDETGEDDDETVDAADVDELEAALAGEDEEEEAPPPPKKAAAKGAPARAAGKARKPAAAEEIEFEDEA